MKTANKIPYRGWLFLTVCLFISLDSRYSLPGATLLRWVMPFGLLALSCWKRRSLVFPIFAPYILVLILFFAASLYSVDVSYSIQRAISFLLITLSFFNYCLLMEDRDALLDLLKTLCLAFVIYEVLNAISLDLSAQRARGITGNPNSLGIWSNVAFLSAMLLYECEKKKIYRLLLLVVMVLSVYTAILSGSRSYTITILLNVFFATYLFLQKRARSLAWLVIMVVMITAVPLLGDSLYKLPGIQRIAEKGFDRGRLWDKGMYLVRQKPLFGWGYGVSQKLNTPAYLGYIVNYEYNMSFHNSYLVILIETGVVGLITVAAMIVSVLAKGIKTYLVTKDRRLFIVLLMLLTMMICFYGSGSMTSVGSTEGFTFWFLLAWLMAYILQNNGDRMILFDRQFDDTNKGRLTKVDRRR